MDEELENRIKGAFLTDAEMKWGFALKHICESPIEQLMLSFLVPAMDLVPWFLDDWALTRFGHANYHLTGVAWPRARTALLQQVCVGGFRVDFAIVSVENESAPHVAIECDGHDFHDRTQEQASHDRERDRHLAACGWTVIRYTGSDIWREPIRCASDAVDTAHRIIDGRTKDAMEAAE